MHETVHQQVLGKGNFGVVHLVYDKKTSQPFACKSISKRKLTTPDDIEDVKREIEILLHLSGHKNVVQMYGAYEDKSYIHVVMEVCAGGELFDRIALKVFCCCSTNDSCKSGLPAVGIIIHSLAL